MTYTETDLSSTIERLAGGGLDTLTPEELDGLDQFHAGGPAAVDRLLATLRPDPAMTVLDVGSGLGGPARQVARRSGARVVGIDITAAYVQAARALSRAADAGRVEFVHTDLAGLARTHFDAAYTMHVQMNVADKTAFFGQIAQHLRPGARFATFEVCRSDPAPLPLPLPWSLDGRDSFLVPPHELHDAITGGGFETVEWTEQTQWVLDWFGRLAVGSLPATDGPTLRGILTDGPQRMLNFARGLADGTFTIHQGAFVRSSGPT